MDEMRILRTYILVKRFNYTECVALAVDDTTMLIQIKALLEEVLDDNDTQIVITNNPKMYKEYAPYNIKANLKEFLNTVLPDELCATVSAV